MENLPKKVRSKKLSTRVDLTAMVSVSFLLIIFFMVTIELRKQKIMDLSLPDNDVTDRSSGGCYGENRSVTILLGENDKLVSYTGLLQVPIVAPKETIYGENGIRKVLHARNKTMLEYSAALGRPGRGITVIIKPSKKCNYKNLVDILDEMTIAKIDTYAIVNEFTPEETNLLATK
ncbi:biopolymer transporter ExbD [Flavobacterium aquidurense]|jgi:biopolymer transport protein ExbD|uniref:ExbD/TolR family protein n=1 Tax=Flavobacterium aquidurense TaxID=362413 RepID=UPI000914B9F2|nr:biopolymer transporter ExbD [Flavobacterium aquidurense]OXA68132.1 biopolymer transporter ExbD [Flavobacterium aquidurense]SHH59975.1 Biopolymer transport protein ExbD/TolR [Flavobacterium frigidimaris]